MVAIMVHPRTSRNNLCFIEAPDGLMRSYWQQSEADPGFPEGGQIHLFLEDLSWQKQITSTVRASFALLAPNEQERIQHFGKGGSGCWF